MEDQFSKLKSETAKIELPDECEENDRAVRFLALEMGVGHYDNLNLLVLSVLVIFISVAFLAVSGGKIRNDEELTFTKESFLSGEFEQGIEKRYIRELPIPEQMRTAEEYISFLYGIGNTIDETGSGNYDIRNRQQAAEEHNPFDDEDERDENAVTTKAVMTDKDGNTVTEADSDETAPGGGTTAVSRPASTYKTYTMPEEDEEMTTTNNEAPFVTITTTVISHNTGSTQDTEDSTEPSDTEPPVTDEPDSKPDTAPSDTEPPPETPEE